jgi:alkylation response protein AidB-like acyl-CoA dehydrogenase
MFNIDLSDIQQQILETARKFAEDEIAPTAIHRDINSEFPSGILKKLGELGFMGFMVSPEYGGSGLDTVSYVIALEEIAGVDASIATIVSVQNSLVNWIIEKYGTEEQKQKYLTRLASGEFLGAFCLSEPEAGSDATQQHTLAEKRNGYWILNGIKNWITSGQTADIYIVFAQTNKALRHKGITCFIIEKGTPGFQPLKREDKLGIRSSDTCSIAITNVQLDDSNVIDKVGEGFHIAMKSLNGGRIGIAAQSVGIAQGAFKAALKYSTERRAFGKSLCDHQAIQFKLADMSMNIEAARLLVRKAAYLKDTNQNYIQASAEAKLFASKIAFDVAREAIQIHGGYGYVREYNVERMLRDAKVTEIYEGTSEIQHLIIARELIKKNIP